MLNSFLVLFVRRAEILTGESVVSDSSFFYDVLSGSSPSMVMGNVFKDLRSNSLSCSLSIPSLTLETVRRLFGVLLLDQYARSLIPAIVFRINRCNNDDLSVLQFLFGPQNLVSSSDLKLT